MDEFHGALQENAHCGKVNVSVEGSPDATTFGFAVNSMERNPAPPLPPPVDAGAVMVNGAELPHLPNATLAASPVGQTRTTQPKPAGDMSSLVGV